MKRKIIALLFLLTILSNCSEHKELKKEEISISYGNTKKIHHGSWIKIDNHKFVHIRKYDISYIENNKKELPTETITLQKIKGKELKENVNQIILLKILYSKLTRLDSNYYTPNPLSIISKGTLIIRKKNNGLISISTSKKYPINQNP